MATTPNHALPAPDPTDLIVNGDDAIRALANALDAILVTQSELSSTTLADLALSATDLAVVANLSGVAGDGFVRVIGHQTVSGTFPTRPSEADLPAGQAMVFLLEGEVPPQGTYLPGDIVMTAASA